MSQFEIRPAQESEAALVLDFIKKLATYEKMLDEVEATPETIHDSLFVKHDAEVVFGCEDGVPVGFALFFHNFSTFVGRKGLYLEDLFVIPEKRGLGYAYKTVEGSGITGAVTSRGGIRLQYKQGKLNKMGQVDPPAPSRQDQPLAF